MKRFAGLLSFSALLAALLINSLLAEQPTVTMTQSTESRSTTVAYTFSFATAIADADTAVLYKTGTTPWYIGYLGGAAVPDSGITIQLETSETTADSSRKKVVMQVSYQDSPSTALVDDDWYNFETATLDSAVSSLYTFNPLRVGRPYKVRFLVIETDADKDATQTITGALCFPKYTGL